MDEEKVVTLLYCVVIVVSLISIGFSLKTINLSNERIELANESINLSNERIELVKIQMQRKEMEANPPVIEILGGNATVVGEVIRMPTNQTVTIVCTRDGKPVKGHWATDGGDADYFIIGRFDFYEEQKDEVGILSINATTSGERKGICYYEKVIDGRDEVFGAIYYIKTV